MASALMSVGLAIAVTVNVGMVGAARQAPPLVSLLDDYVQGRVDRVATALDAFETPDGVLSALERDAAAWIAMAETPALANRRRLAAATLALEAARLYSHHPWKLRVDFMRKQTLFWQAPPLLIEWGCQLLREVGEPSEAERIWHIAAMGVVARSADPEFMFGNPLDLNNPGASITHLRHARERFPDDGRLALAEAVVNEWQSYPAPGRGGPQAARRLLERLQDDLDVGPEATLRLGYVWLRQGDVRRATDHFARVDTATRDPWLLYLARLFSGRAHELQGRASDAEHAYRGALEVRPGTSSASLALGALLTRHDRRQEAAATVMAIRHEADATGDPWRGYVRADDRFWPELLARLREHVQR